ncbi:class I SAM-dependent methyltransferase [Methanospirillum sp.]
MRKINYKEYWATKSSPGNRRDDNEFCQKKINEVLLHIKRGGIILDYGCGNCNQTKFLSPHFDRIIASDLSECMLVEAKKEVEFSGIKNIIHLQADEDTVWEKIKQKVNGIISTGVIQYFQSQQLEKFIEKCVSNTTDDGFIVFFDVINPLKFLFFRYNLVNNRGSLINFVRCIIHATYLYFLEHNPEKNLGEIGYGYYPEYFIKICMKNNLNIEVVSSIYYEYRYHVIIKKRIY